MTGRVFIGGSRGVFWLPGLLVGVLLLGSSLQGTMWQVRQDGTGDYMQIQMAILAAGSGDTVLVAPGVYQETIDFQGKDLVVASQYLLTGADSLIHQTVIDGQQQGSVVTFRSGESRAAQLIGFTIQHGSGSVVRDWIWGGGVYIEASSPTLTSCLIENNVANVGGGIAVFHNYRPTTPNPLLRDMTVRKNHAFLSGGGLSVAASSHVTFDSLAPSSFYLNAAGRGTDINYSNLDSLLRLYVDTLTVEHPDSYFIHTRNRPYASTINAGKLQPVAADLYVSPTGNDGNSGISPAEPVQTITRALSLVDADSLHPRTIHLAPGRYSPNQTGEFFPLNARSYVTLQGAGMGQTILDADSLGDLIYGRDREQQFALKQLTLTGGNGERTIFPVLTFKDNVNLLLDSLEITANYFESSIVAYESDSVMLRDSNIHHNYGVRGGHFHNNTSVIIENTNVHDNGPVPWVGDFFDQNGGGLRIAGYYNREGAKTVLRNIAITDNENTDRDWGGMISALGLGHNIDATLINCTISGNRSATNQVAAVGIGTDTVRFINSVLADNIPRSLQLHSQATPTNHSTVMFQNTLLQDGPDSILYNSPPNLVDWDGTNLDTLPAFTGDSLAPYRPAAGSPLIDAGTVDTAGLCLPPTDLAGNPRIVDGRIDIGAYEYQGLVSTQAEPASVPASMTLQAYPNPFNSRVTVRLQIPEAGRVRVIVYDVRGRLIKELMNAYTVPGKSRIQWDGRNGEGGAVASGPYFLRYSLGGHVKTRKVVLLR